MRVGAFLFDLDGTLIDTESLWTRAMVDFINERGDKTCFENLVPIVIGRNWIDIDKDLHRLFPKIGDTTPEEDAVELRAYYLKYATDPEGMKIKPSIAFLKEVSKFAPCAIVSGSPHDDIVAATKLCGIEKNVSLVLGAGEYEAGKPSPSGYLKAAKLLNVEPEECVVIEDSSVGVKSGVDAGMRVIALDRGTSAAEQVYEKYEWKVSSLSEIDIDKEFE